MTKKRRAQRPADSVPTLLLISYVPLLTGQAGVTYDRRHQLQALRQMLQHIDQAPTGQVASCFWMLDDQGQPGPVLALPQAEAIADHLVAWSSGRPEQWFQLYCQERAGRYALILLPNLEASLQRFQFAHLVAGGAPIQLSQVQTVTRPLHFLSRPTPVFAAVKDRLGAAVPVGLVDSSRLDPADPKNLDPAHIKQLGAIPVGNADDPAVQPYFDDLFTTHAR